MLRQASLYLLLGAVAGGCGVSQSLYDKRASELERCHSDAAAHREETERRLVELYRDRGELTRRAETLRGEVERLQFERSQLADDLQATRRDIEDLRQARQLAIARNRAYQALTNRLGRLLEAGQAAAVVRRGRLTIALPDALLFEGDGAELRPEGKQALREVAGALREVRERELLVAAHTDVRPGRDSRFSSNWELSTARAIAVVRFLQASGVDPRLLSAAGYSEFSPVTSAPTNSAAGANRRVEIAVLPSAEELPQLDDTERTPPNANVNR